VTVLKTALFLCTAAIRYPEYNQESITESSKSQRISHVFYKFG